jgi:molybdopterin synthase catalytic subunit
VKRASVVARAIETQALVDAVARDSNGATAIFLGTVRSTNDGRAVTGIDYSAYEEMAASEMNLILDEVSSRFEIDGALIEHRIGTLAIGETSIAVVIAAPHRAAALDALRYVVDETKRRAPIWKLEHYSDGSREWVGAAEGARR